MTYVQGFVLPVPADRKEAYRKAAADFSPIAREFGATRQVEAWGDDVPDGKLTDFKGAVKAKPDEVVVFSWIEYPSKEVADAANQKLMNDPRMEKMDMPFDGKRMIVAGFAPILDEAGKAGKTGYVDGFVAAVPDANKQAYLDMAKKAAAVFKDYGAVRIVETWGDNVPDGKVTDYKGAVKATADEKIVYSWVEWPSKQAYLDMAKKAAAVFKDYGAVRIVETWGDNVPDGKVTDYKGAVKATPDEKIVYSWVEWPSKQVRDEGWKKMMEDQRMKDHQMPFDGKRMIYGGFAPILDV